MSDARFVLRPEDVVPTTPPKADADADVDVAVVVQLNLPDQNAETYGLLKRFTSITLETLQYEGARVRLYDVTDDAEPDYAAIRDADAVVVLGGGDVDPSKYGNPDPVPNAFGIDPRSDDRQLRVIDEAIERDAALLAVCRGSQLLNVACGGTLVPDLEPNGLHQGQDVMFIDEDITLDPDSIVGRIYEGRTAHTVRSGHHQAVDVLGENLRVTATAQDGVVEGTEHTDRTWVVGVQWHPEDSDGSVEDRHAIFRAILDEARRRRDDSQHATEVGSATA